MKLEALVRTQADSADLVVETASGRALVHDGDRAWCLADHEPGRSLGPALAWAHRREVSRLTMVVDDAAVAATLARRADLFTTTIDVDVARERELVPAVATPAEVGGTAVPPGAEDLAAVLVDVGAEVVVEHGTLTGEVRGLEVARVVVDDADDPSSGARLEVGVGVQDREAFAAVHGDLPLRDAVAKVVDAVRRHRAADDPDHPLGRVVPERWLRHILADQPELVGCDRLTPVPATVARSSLSEVIAAPLVGADAEGRAVVVAASVGIDLDLVPSAADAAATHGAIDSRLVLSVPERDRHPLTEALAAQLVRPASVVTVPDNWRTLDRR